MHPWLPPPATRDESYRVWGKMAKRKPRIAKVLLLGGERSLPETNWGNSTPPPAIGAILGEKR